MTTMLPALLYATLNRGIRIGLGGLARAQSLLSEIPVILYSPTFERIATDDHYLRHQDIYCGKGQKGLFAFEERVLQNFFPEPPARILVHGAGGGREVQALVDRGYRVEAFEPVPALAEKARAAVSAAEGRLPAITNATVQEWSRDPAGTFDAVMTGWGMWTHVLRHSDRLQVLKAFRRVCPGGPVLLSFWREENVFFDFRKERSAMPVLPQWTGFKRLTRDYLRKKALRLSPIERGTGWSQGFFIHRVSEGELREEAESSRYRLAFYEHDNFCYPHAVLVPDASQP